MIDVGGLCFVSDPTFDNSTDYGGLRRIWGPAITTADVANADVVLISHTDHIDNLDASGRAFVTADVAGGAAPSPRLRDDEAGSSIFKILILFIILKIFPFYLFSFFFKNKSYYAFSFFFT